MWKTPATFLYPLYGFSFPTGNVFEIWYYFLFKFSSSYMPALSYYFVSEIIGIIILIGLSGFAIGKTLCFRKKNRA